MTRMGVVIISYNTREHLRACLQSVYEAGPDEVVVVDNASTDGSPAMVASDFPKVTLLANTSNSGYGAAANQGIGRCHSEYVLLLNSDTRLPPDTLMALAAYLDGQPQAALVGPRLVQPDGTLQPSCYPFPTPLNTLLAETGAGMLLRYAPLLRQSYLPTWDHSRPRRVPWVQGSAVALRRSAWHSVAGFDESFFMYFEEVDLCYRLTTAGWEVHFAPVTDVVHYGGASTNQRRVAMAVQQLESTRHFARQHFSARQQRALGLTLKGIALGRLSVNWLRLRLTRDQARHAIWTDNITAWQRVVFRTRVK